MMTGKTRRGMSLLTQTMRLWVLLPLLHQQGMKTGPSSCSCHVPSCSSS